MRTDLTVSAGGVRARAILFRRSAPKTTAALLEMLPLERPAFAVQWTGDAATIHLDIDSHLPSREGLESPVTSIYPGALVFRPESGASKLLIGFGVAEFRWHLGVDYNCLIGRLTENKDAMLAVLAGVNSGGEIDVRIESVGTEERS